MVLGAGTDLEFDYQDIDTKRYPIDGESFNVGSVMEGRVKDLPNGEMFRWALGGHAFTVSAPRNTLCAIS